MACKSRLRSPGSRYEWSFLVSVDVEVQVSMVERPAVEETGRQSVHHVCGPSRDRRGRVRTVRLRIAALLYVASLAFFVGWRLGQTRGQNPVSAERAVSSPATVLSPCRAHRHTTVPPHRQCTSAPHRAALSPSLTHPHVSSTPLVISFMASLFHRVYSTISFVSPYNVQIVHYSFITMKSTT